MCHSKQCANNPTVTRSSNFKIHRHYKCLHTTDLSMFSSHLYHFQTRLLWNAYHSSFEYCRRSLYDKMQIASPRIFICNNKIQMVHKKSITNRADQTFTTQLLSSNYLQRGKPALLSWYFSFYTLPVWNLNCMGNDATPYLKYLPEVLFVLLHASVYSSKCWELA